MRDGASLLIWLRSVRGMSGVGRRRTSVIGRRVASVLANRSRAERMAHA